MVKTAVVVVQQITGIAKKIIDKQAQNSGMDAWDHMKSNKSILVYMNC